MESQVVFSSPRAHFDIAWRGYGSMLRSSLTINTLTLSQVKQLVLLSLVMMYVCSLNPDTLIYLGMQMKVDE